MSQASRDPADLVAQLQELRARIERLESRTGPRRFTTAARPPASELPGVIIYNTTTAKHQGSNGAAWTDLY